MDVVKELRTAVEEAMEKGIVDLSYFRLAMSECVQNIY